PASFGLVKSALPMSSEPAAGTGFGFVSELMSVRATALGLRTAEPRLFQPTVLNQVVTPAQRGSSCTEFDPAGFRDAVTLTLRSCSSFVLAQFCVVASRRLMPHG